jgi:hypothetical protein
VDRSRLGASANGVQKLSKAGLTRIEDSYIKEFSDKFEASFKVLKDLW